MYLVTISKPTRSVMALVVTGKSMEKIVGPKKGCQKKRCYGMTETLGDAEMVVQCDIIVAV